MIGTIMEYAGQRLAEAGESDLARHAHLAYFTELAETADPQLRRAEQLDWLATLEAEHDNIGAAMRGALAAGEAQSAMRLAAGAGWYWWLGGHKTEGIELLTAATEAPGEVTDEVRAMVYGLLVQFVSAGRGDEHQAAEWIHQAYRFSQRSQLRHPALGFVAALERMLQAPDAFLTAWEPLLGDEDPWVRAIARLQLGKMRIMLGQGGREADAYLETALAEFRALGERFGISFALTELADRIAVRGEFAGACEHYEQAIAVVTEVGATEDVIRMRSRQAQLYWLLGDEDGQRGRHRRGTAVRGTGHLAGCAGRAGPLEGGTRPLGRRRGGGAPATRRRDDPAGRRSGAGEHPRGDARPARLPRRRSRRGPRAPRGGLAGGDRGGARAPDRDSVSSASRTWHCAAASTSRPRGCSRRAPPCAGCRIAPSRTWPGSSRQRGAASATRGSPRRRGRGRGRAGLELAEVTLAS